MVSNGTLHILPRGLWQIRLPTNFITSTYLIVVLRTHIAIGIRLRTKLFVYIQPLRANMVCICRRNAKNLITYQVIGPIKAKTSHVPTDNKYILVG